MGVGGNDGARGWLVTKVELWGRNICERLLKHVREDRKIKDESVKRFFNFRGHHQFRMEEALNSMMHSDSSSMVLPEGRD